VSLALLIIGNGRLDYLHEAVDSLDVEADHYLMIDDSGDSNVARQLIREYPDFHIEHHTHNRGMAAAVQHGWDMVLATNATHVLHWEEDFTQTAPLPIREACRILDTHQHVAQLLFQRQPLTPDEHEQGGVLAAMRYYARPDPNRVRRTPPTQYVDHNGWAEQTHIFSLNPSIIPRRVLELGWPTGPIGIGNETGMTDRLRYQGFTFGVWKAGPLVHHIGESRAKNWQL
jgi:GT2 family glycosyltransferase